MARLPGVTPDKAVHKLVLNYSVTMSNVATVVTNARHFER